MDDAKEYVLLACWVFDHPTAPTVSGFAWIIRLLRDVSGPKASAFGPPVPVKMQAPGRSDQGEFNDAIFFRQGSAEQTDGLHVFDGLVKLNEGQVAFR